MKAIKDAKIKVQASIQSDQVRVTGRAKDNLQLPEDERRTAVRRGFGALRVGGTLFVVAHDSTNLTEGTGGPQSASVLYTSEEVLGDLDGERFEVERAERVARVLPSADGMHTHRGDETRTAYDCLVRIVRA